MSKSSQKSFRGLPGGVWALGFVSLLMDTSSELVHSLLPAFMYSVLGASMATIGIIEGVAEATAAITKVFSGALSDYLKKRKALAVVGYGLATITKPIFPLANHIGWVFAARFTDRIGKGIRGAPRDALIAEITPGEQRGAAYGLRQSLDSVGAFIGPLLAVALMALLADRIRAVLWLAVIPAVLCVIVLVFGVHEPKDVVENRKSSAPLTWRDAKRLPIVYWAIVLIGAVLSLARFSEAFLLLRAEGLGLAIGYVPVVMIVMNVVYASGAYPAGVMADRLSRRTCLILGLVPLVLADAVLAAAATPIVVLLGAALWGLHMALTQGLLSKLVADTSPQELRGTAFGVFNLVSGVALLLASGIAGALWTAFGASLTFITGGSFALIALIALLVYHPRSTPS